MEQWNDITIGDVINAMDDHKRQYGDIPRDAESAKARNTGGRNRLATAGINWAMVFAAARHGWGPFDRDTNLVELYEAHRESGNKPAHVSDSNRTIQHLPPFSFGKDVGHPPPLPKVYTGQPLKPNFNIKNINQLQVTKIDLVEALIVHAHKKITLLPHSKDGEINVEDVNNDNPLTGKKWFTIYCLARDAGYENLYALWVAMGVSNDEKGHIIHPDLFRLLDSQDRRQHISDFLREHDKSGDIFPLGHVIKMTVHGTAATRKHLEGVFKDKPWLAAELFRKPTPGGGSNN